MNKLTFFTAVFGIIVPFTGCSDTQPSGRVEITPPAAELAFDEAFVKDRDIHFQMPKGVVLGWASPIVDPEGNLIVVDYIQSTVFLTDAEGNYLRQIGARGGAEGEYFTIYKVLLAPNGDLYIHCSREGRKFLVFSGRSYEFKREIPDPNPELIDHIVLTAGGHIYGSQVDVIDAGSAGVREDGQYALFRFDANLNKVVGLYPVEDTRTGRALNRYHNTILASRTGGGFYFMYPTTYEIHQYSDQGELERVLFSNYRSKHRDGIKSFPDGLDPHGFNPKIEAWFAEHIVRSQLFECDLDLLVLEQYRREVGGGGKATFYLNILNKNGYSIADGIRVPAKLYLAMIRNNELYFTVKGAFDEVTGETGDPYVVVYRLNDRTGAGKVAFSRSGDQ